MKAERPPLPGQLHWHLQVSDMKRSIDFYTTLLGFYYDHGVREMAWLTRQQMLLTLSPGEPSPVETQYQGFLLGTPAELESWYGYLRQRGARLSGPPDPAGGRSFFFLYDPDDYPLAFSTVALDYPQRLAGPTAER
jgi:catechol 2,3-dioxygenase-like lactoylglutathione lyase family enzyme